MATIREIKLMHATFRDASEADLPGFIDQSLETCRLVAIELGNRLAEIGYPVHPIVGKPNTNAALYMDRIEARCGVPIPYVLRRFWEVIGELSFVDLNSYQHVDFWNEQAVMAAWGYCVGVYVEACNVDF